MNPRRARRDPGSAARPGSEPEAADALRVFLVDDHPIVRRGLASLIEGEPDLVVSGQAEDAVDALAAIQADLPDVVLVDLSLGSTSGLSLLKELAGLQVTTIVVSMHKDPTWVERALAAGASGYLHKSEATEQVVAAIRRATTGRLYLSESLSEQMVRRHVGPHTAEPLQSLSDRELDVYERIGRGLTTMQIGEELCLSPKTVQTYRQRIKQKLGLASAAELSTAATRWVVSLPARE